VRRETPPGLRKAEVPRAWRVGTFQGSLPRLQRGQSALARGVFYRREDVANAALALAHAQERVTENEHLRDRDDDPTPLAAFALRMGVLRTAPSMGGLPRRPPAR
jgi:hypothetical protein